MEEDLPPVLGAATAETLRDPMANMTWSGEVTGRSRSGAIWRGLDEIKSPKISAKMSVNSKFREHRSN